MVANRQYDNTERWGGQCAGIFVMKPGFQIWLGQCVEFLGKTPYSHSASLHPVVEMGIVPLLPGVQMGTVKLSGKPDEMLGGNLALDWHPIQGGVVFTSCGSMLQRSGYA